MNNNLSDREVLIYLSEILQNIEKCSDKLQRNEIKEAFNILDLLIEDFSLFTNLYNYYDEKFGEKGISIEQFNNNLQLIIQGIETKDYILISDIMIYEMSELLKEFMNYIYRKCDSINI